MLKVTLLGFAVGCLGTLLGGIIGLFINTDSKKIYAFILEFTSGLMMSIVCFELLPEAMNLSSIWVSLIGFCLGILIIVIVDSILENKNKNINNSYLLGLMIVVSIAIHNFPEGLAIGSGYDVSATFGLGLLIAIALHDIPEGISIVLPMKKDKNVKKYILLLYPFLSGVPTGIGAFIGYLLGGISNVVISLCLSLAAGVMTYVVIGDILPESKNEYKGRFSSIGNILGMIIGLVITYI